MLHSLFVLAVIFCSIRPLLYTKTMLLISIPLTLVSAAVEMRINAIAICFVLSPFTFVDVAFGMYKSTKPIGHAITPETIVSRAIRPYLNATTIFLTLSIR